MKRLFNLDFGDDDDDVEEDDEFGNLFNEYTSPHPPKVPALAPKEDNVVIDDNICELKHYVRQGPTPQHFKNAGHTKVYTITRTQEEYPSVSHTWHCSGTLLRLLDSMNPDNLNLFQEIWRRGQPVMASNVADKLNPELWTPESFSRDFGETRTDLVNCMTGKRVPNQLLKKFWDGFNVTSKRLKDEDGKPMLLKLKDWPDSEDFAVLLPNRFEGEKTISVFLLK